MKVGEQSGFKTFLSYSIPCIISMFLTSFITIVDGLFVGWKLGRNGLAAVNLSLPVLYILLAVTIMIGVGGVTLGAQSLGEKKRDQASNYFTTAFGLVVAVNIVAVIVLFFFQDGIIGMLHAQGVLYGYVRDYLGMIKYFYVFMMANLIFSMFIRSEGKPQLSLAFGVVGNVLNIFLDYWFIMKLGYGMKGAALASGLSVLIPFLFGVGYFISRRSVYKWVKVSLNRNDLGKIFLYGSAEFIAQISMSITIYIFNWVILRRIGTSGVAAYTIIGYLSFIQYMIISGIAVGIHPVLSYHFGAKQPASILSLLSIALRAVTFLGVIIFLMSLLFGDPIARMFAKNDSTVVHLTVFGLRIFSLAFILNGYNMIAAVYFTSLGAAKEAAMISIMRSIVLLNSMVIVLP
ncbi:MAG TPA: MATE family efflux transporter, partial [Bacillota bacterium]|nr:MATE family efflux transporter [Bacillota bacterium]